MIDAVRDGAQPFPGGYLAERQLAWGPFAGDVAAFLIPSLMFLEVNVVGRLFLPEIILIVLLAILFPMRQNPLAMPLARKLIVLGIVWLCSQILTDIVRGTPFVDWSRGWAKIIFVLIDFAAIYLLIGNRQSRVTIFAVGVAVGQVLDFYIAPNIYAEGHPWKFGIGYAITLFLVLIAQARVAKRVPWGPGLIVGSAAVLNLLMGFRSLALICIATVVYMFVHRYSASKNMAAKVNVVSLVKVVLLMGATAFIFAEGYGYAADEGWLGEESKAKYEAQASGKFGVLLGGRVELFASTLAIMDSPLIGHGSWAKDPKYAIGLLEQLAEYDYESPGEIESDLIPTHSYLFGAWVESGIVGAIFWLWVLLFVLKVLLILYKTKDKLVPLVAFIGFGLVWNIPFSPFGAEGRFYNAYYLVLLMFVWCRSSGAVSEIVKKRRMGPA